MNGRVDVVANSGQHPLFGVGLLGDRKLTIDYPSHSVTIE